MFNVENADIISDELKESIIQFITKAIMEAKTFNVSTENYVLEVPDDFGIGNYEYGGIRSISFEFPCGVLLGEKRG